MNLPKISQGAFSVPGNGKEGRKLFPFIKMERRLAGGKLVEPKEEVVEPPVAHLGPRPHSRLCTEVLKLGGLHWTPGTL